MECGMERRFHRGFTAAEKTELWDRWKRGESLKAIGRAFGKQSSSIYFLVAPHGGIRPNERRRSRLALTLAEREVISRGVTAHRSARSIAKLLGRSPSTVSREMSRNGGYDRYRATLADENAWARSRRPKCCKLATNPRLRQAVAGKLRLDWSPEQIAGWLKRTHPEDECNRCHTRPSIAACLSKRAACSRKSCLAIFDRSARCAAPGRLTRMAINGDISRISSQSVSDRRRLKIGRCLVTGRAICCPGRTTPTSRPWSSVIPAT
jgi:DNA-binding CsgD family transcriptional regulator